MSQLKRLTTPNVDAVVEQLELSNIAVKKEMVLFGQQFSFGIHRIPILGILQK
jgi:hypothetical protein